MLGIPQTQTRQRKENRAAASLGGGTTAKLGGGPTARGTGNRGTTKRMTTLGGTTSNSRKGEDQDIEWDEHQ